MGKRSNEARQTIMQGTTPMLDAMGIEPEELIDSERDYLPTPYKGVLPLLPHLPKGLHYDEPCAGNGILARHLSKHGFLCNHAFDISPQGDAIEQGNLFDITKCYGKMFITNPPWTREILHPLIIHLSDIVPTWLLFDADWMHTRQSSELILRCQKIVSVGRLKWIPGSKMTGKDNCAWYLFGKEIGEGPKFYGRTP